MGKFSTPSAPAIYTATYSDFRGVDFNSDDVTVENGRFPYAQNLTFEKRGYPEKRQGFKFIQSLSGNTNAMQQVTLTVTENSTEVQKDIMLIHSGTDLYAFDGTIATKINGETDLNNCHSTILQRGTKAYIFDGCGIYTYDGAVFEEVEGYVPTTTIGRNWFKCSTNDPEAVNIPESKNDPGNAYEPINCIQEKRINTFALTAFIEAGSTVSTVYNKLYLDGIPYAIEKVEFLKSDGSWITIPTETEYTEGSTEGSGSVNNYSFGSNSTEGWITFNSIYSSSAFDATYGHKNIQAPYNAVTGNTIDNVRITFSVNLDETVITKCNIGTTFGIGKGDRAFIGGNSNHPNRVYYSQMNDFSYFPDINYITLGDELSGIKGFSKLGEYLIAFKDNHGSDANIFLISAVLSDGEALFTVKTGINGVTAVSEKGFAIVDDEPYFLSDDGIYGICSTNIVYEKTAVNRSYFVNPMLIKSENISNGCMVVFKNKVITTIGDKTYVLYKNMKAYKQTAGEGYILEAMLWTGIPSVCYGKYLDKLYFGSNDGNIYEFDDNFRDQISSSEVNAIDAYFETALDTDSKFMQLKTMIKRGCGIMVKPYIQSSVKIYAITDSAPEKLIKSETMGIMDFSNFYFETVDFNSSKSVRIIPFNSKIKKYSALKFIVRNDVINEGFGVFGIEKRFTYGGYKKY